MLLLLFLQCGTNKTRGRSDGIVQWGCLMGGKESKYFVCRAGHKAERYTGEEVTDRYGESGSTTWGCWHAPWDAKIDSELSVGASIYSEVKLEDDGIWLHLRKCSILRLTDISREWVIILCQWRWTISYTFQALTRPVTQTRYLTPLMARQYVGLLYFYIYAQWGSAILMTTIYSLSNSWLVKLLQNVVSRQVQGRMMSPWTTNIASSWIW